MCDDKTIKLVPFEHDDDKGIVFSQNFHWIMEIYEKEGRHKIKFNTEEFPDLAENDFAEKVIHILQECGYLGGKIYG